MQAPAIRRVALIGLFLCLFPSLSSAAEPTGRWRGSWKSVSTGHRGALRARVRAVDSDTYRAVFAGRFALVVPFVYPSTLHRVPGTQNCYQTSTRLPLLGEYRMTASITSGRFYARYSSRNDHGVFDLSR